MYRPLEKFQADRGPHLAAMIAYFALLSFVPLTFLAFATLGFAGRADESSYLVTELKRAFPDSSISSIVTAVRTVQKNATTLGVVGAVFLTWTSLSLFSVLESAFNIVYGRPNRGFLHGKARAVVLLVGSLVVLFVSLLAGSLGFDVLKPKPITRIGKALDNSFKRCVRDLPFAVSSFVEINSVDHARQPDAAGGRQAGRGVREGDAQGGDAKHRQQLLGRRPAPRHHLQHEGGVGDVR